MRHNNLFSAAILLGMIALLTMSGMPSRMAKPGAVVITISGVPEGTFTASGALQTSGTNHMEVRPSGKSQAGAIHCTNTLTTPEGTFTLLMNCQFSTNTGTWRIVGGTGAYWNLRGTGSLVMTTPGGVFVETLSGKIF